MLPTKINHLAEEKWKKCQLKRNSERATAVEEKFTIECPSQPSSVTSVTV